ncbi:matrixin [Halococcus agarilyticus]|uniref:matrixin n=1 Tax=Halococcus agarilyticus TaxID=1232219 RepID=UPI000677609C|nr:matrixin [Halococcus agarilyticus]
MAGIARALAVACLVVLAGCVGGGLPDELAGYTGDPDNPYPDDELTVALDPGDADRAFDPLVREALTYWEQNDDRYLDFTVNFTLVPNATDPDLRVTFQSSLERCGEVETAAGCAPRVTRPPQTANTVDVRVLDDLSNESTVRVLEHELGHTLGLSHDDPPTRLMRAHAVLTSLPEPNASERTLPWDDPTLTVFADLDAVPADERDAVDEQLRRALSYYDRGADGLAPTNLSFLRVDSFENADVVIHFPADPPCEADARSCGSVYGVDPDGDSALERYTRVDISLTGVDTDAAAWHVARRLALGFGAENGNESAYPPVLRASTDGEERRGDWWR